MRNALSLCRLSELRRDLQAKIANVNVNINIGPSVENYGGETFLSQEVSINILQETKLAFKRCQMVGKISKMLDIIIVSCLYGPCYLSAESSTGFEKFRNVLFLFEISRNV